MLQMYCLWSLPAGNDDFVILNQIVGGFFIPGKVLSFLYWALNDDVIFSKY
jgi:hypothetical protein